MYTREILQFAGWPAMIWISYKLVFWAVKYYEKKYPYNQEEHENSY